MATAVRMPQQGQTVEACLINQWYKAVGDSVAVGDVLCEIETDKALVQVESASAGTLLARFFEAGTEVPVQTVIAVIGEAGEDFSHLQPDLSVGSAPAASHRESPLQGQAPASSPAPAPSLPSPATAPASAGTNGSDYVSPRARTLAARKGVALDGLHGTGPGGRIIERDVRRAAEAHPPLTAAARMVLDDYGAVVPDYGSGMGGRVRALDVLMPPPADDAQHIPVRGARRVIAERMRRSLQESAQLTLHSSADARALRAYRARLKQEGGPLGLQEVTLNDLILLVVARTLPQFPALNATFHGTHIMQFADVHLGMAVDTERGLLVPVIRRANRLSLQELASATKSLAQAAQEGSIAAEGLQGGSFTVTNLGALGIEQFTPILNPPQVAILGVGAITLRAVESAQGVEHLPHLGLSLTVDHQAVDGAPAARFLAALRHNLTQPDLLLAL